MDPLAFLTWQFILFSLLVATIMYVLRSVLEYFIPRLTTIKIWNSLLLMILPILIGAGLGYVLSSYPYATGLTTTGDHIGYGAVAGLLSTIIFKVVKEMLGQKIGGAISSIMGAMGINTGSTAGTEPTGSMMGSHLTPIAPEPPKPDNNANQ